VSAQLRSDEGVRFRPYLDTANPPNISIGIGRNLSAEGVSRGEIALMFDNDLADAEHAVRLLVPRFDLLSDGRKAVLMNMAFNLGYARLAKFVRMLRAVNEGRYTDAAAEIRDSELAPARKERLAVQMGSTAA
jgi:lysozyme